MAQYKPKSSEESSPEEKIFEKGWLEITKKECLFGCIGLPVFLAVISAIIAPYFTLWSPIEDVNQPKLMNPQVEEIEQLGANRLYKKG